MELPDELLLIILKNLNIKTLHSLIGSNSRLDQIICDPFLTNEINLIKFDDDDSCDQVNAFIDRFCLDILPIIHHRIKSLKVQSTFMERVLLTADYPQLSQLGIVIRHNEHIQHFNGE